MNILLKDNLKGSNKLKENQLIQNVLLEKCKCYRFSYVNYLCELKIVI